jgi:arylsulfatase A-like enzyme
MGYPCLSLTSMIKLVSVLLVWLTLMPILVAQTVRSPRPNILFVLCDDLGYGDLGVFFQNQRHQENGSLPSHFTPQIDRLAAEGVRLPHHYCPAPVCAPSRASLLLGVHQGHANVRDNQFDKALENNHTLATVMRGAGYVTAAIGKWGLQGVSTNTPPDWPAHPLNRGFDYFYGYMRHADGHEHYPKEGLYRKPKEVWENRVEVSGQLDKCYTADLFTARAKQWILDHQRTNAAQPFFLYLAFDTPHATLELPTQAYPSGGGKKGGLQWLGRPGQMINTAGGVVDSWYHPDYAHATHTRVTNGTALIVPWPDVYKRFATDVRRIDDSVGDLIQLLKDLGIDRNTLVVFTSDNGPSRESYLKEDYEPTFFQSYGPFDGIKRDCWEGGIRVGAIARWPGHFKPNRVNNLPCGFWDWMPTFAELAGVPAPARSDGVSLVPALTGRGTQRTPTVYIEYFLAGRTPHYPEFEPDHRDRLRRQMQAIRFGDYLGVRYNITNQATDFEIYNVVLDPKQTHNIAAVNPALQQRMKDRVLQVRRPDPDAKRPYDRELVPAAKAVGIVSNQLEYAVFSGTWPWLPSLDALTPIKQGHTTNLVVSVSRRTTNFGMRFSGYFLAPVDGEYTFYLKTDAGAALRLHDALVIDDDFSHSGAEVSGTIRLQAGVHPLRLFYRHRTGAPTLQLEYAGPSIPRQSVPSTAFGTARPPVSPPVPRTDEEESPVP